MRSSLRIPEFESFELGVSGLKADIVNSKVGRLELGSSKFEAMSSLKV